MLRLTKCSLPVARALKCYFTSCDAFLQASVHRVPVRFAGNSWIFARAFSKHHKQQTITFNLAQPGEGILECEILQWHTEVSILQSLAIAFGYV